MENGMINRENGYYLGSMEQVDRNQNALISKVLVIYSGGTIGMLNDGDKGLTPAKKKLHQAIRANPVMHDVEYANLRLNITDGNKFFVLPWTEGKCRILYEIYEYDELLDSSNMSFENWKQIATDIYNNYNKYDGFVILHGTDTMAYTASALSFMLENLGKSVIVTGSQIPIFQVVSDGRDNFISSLILAGNYNIPEVTVFFNHKLLRGNRVTKTSSESFNAFESCNMAPLARVGVNFEVSETLILRQDTIAKFQIHSKLNSNVAILRLFPSISIEVVRSFLSAPLEGIVIQSYGAGNMPSNREGFLELFAQASSRGILIVNCTQCLKGSVLNLYESSKLFAKVGVISGFDMTAEAALTKMAYVLGKSQWDLKKKKEIMMKSIRGELTQNPDPVFEYNALVGNISKTLHLSYTKELMQLKAAISHVLISTAVLNNDLESIKKLCDSGLNIHAVNSDHRSVLHIAAVSGHLGVIEFLLLKGLSVHAKDSYGHTALTDAILNERNDVVELLVSNGASVDFHTLGENLTRCAANGHLKRIQLYEKAGADLSIANKNGRTSLHEACLHNKEDVVKYLLERGINKNIEDLLGVTPLDIAIKLNHSRVTELLKMNIQN